MLNYFVKVNLVISIDGILTLNRHLCLLTVYNYNLYIYVQGV